MDTGGLDVDFKETDFKILGSNLIKRAVGQENWTDLLGKVRQRLGFWGLRQMTFEGKVLILNR